MFLKDATESEPYGGHAGHQQKRNPIPGERALRSQMKIQGNSLSRISIIQDRAARFYRALSHCGPHIFLEHRASSEKPALDRAFRLVQLLSNLRDLHVAEVPHEKDLPVA